MCDLFLEHSRRHHADGTYANYRHFLQAFCDAHGRLLAATVKPFHVTRWLDAHPAWTGGRRHAVMAVKRAFSFADQQGVLSPNPVRTVPVDPVRHRTRVLSAEERAEILAAIKDELVTALLAASLAAPVPKEKAKADFWPRSVGDKWVYTQGGQEVSEEVGKVTEKDGETRVTTTYTAGPGNSWEVEYVVKRGAVYQAKNGPYTFDPPVRKVDTDLKVGAKWESKTPLTKGVLGSGGEMVVGEEEEVTVPAGTFQAVPVVYTVTEVDGKPIAKPTVYNSWYAAGVGVLKLKYDGGEKVPEAFTPDKPGLS